MTYIAVPIVSDEDNLGVARVSRLNSNISASLGDITLTLFVACLVAGGGAALVALVIAGATTRSLGRLAQAARRLAGGQLGERAPSAATAEVADLADAFNAMAASLQGTISRLAEERNRLESLLASSADAVVAVDRDGLITFTNAAAEALFRVSRAEAVGKPFLHVVRDHELNELASRCATLGERGLRVIAYGPEQRWLQASAVPIEGGGDWAGLVILHDLSEVRRLDTVRRDFITNVSHELRTPLAGIKASAETLKEGALRDPEAAAEFVRHIENETDRLAQMVEELLELSRIESGAAPLRMGVVPVAPLVERCVQRFAPQAERAGLSLSAEVAEGEELAVQGDEERLAQALANLLHNAIKFTPAGGQVIVSAVAQDGEVAIAVRTRASASLPKTGRASSNASTRQPRREADRAAASAWPSSSISCRRTAGGRWWRASPARAPRSRCCFRGRSRRRPSAHPEPIKGSAALVVRQAHHERDTGSPRTAHNG